MAIDVVEGETGEPPHAGRPRDELREQAILDAALDLLCEVGYEGFSMDALAARARASKATIYRRWSGKAEVVVEAVRRRKCGPGFAPPDTGSLREDLLGFIGDSASAADDVAIIVGVVRAMRNDPELAELMQSQVFAQKTELVTSIIDRAVARGELPPDVDPSVMIETVWALVFSRLVLNEGGFDESFCRHVIDRIALPLLRA